MKKSLFLFLLFCSLWAIAQKDTSGIQFPEPPDSTALGSPDGKLVGKEIGPSGGMITSDDGRIELVFPAGALTAITTISIQPTTNLAPNGTGKAYWFEPSGTQFKKPVQIVFHYTEKESDICPPEWMSLAMQDHNGKWTFIDYDEWDSTAKTLKGFIHHFSGVSNVNNLELKPEKTLIPVNESIYIDVLDISRLKGNQFAQFSNSNVVVWYVNEEVNGTPKTGRIEKGQNPATRTTKKMWATYIAPSIMPAINPVKIWAEVYRNKELQKRLTTYINIYDAYKIKVECEYTGREGMGSRLIDSASFLVGVSSKSVRIWEDQIKNYEPIVLEEGKKAGMTEKLFVSGAEGLIHITTAIQLVSVSKDDPPEVYFEFKSVPVLLDRFQYLVRGGLATEITSLRSASIPIKINFLANGERQVITEDSKPKYKVIVTPYRKE